jgi:hypothetical protein
VDAARELVSALSQANPLLLVFFAGIAQDGAVIGRALMERFPHASVVGCSSNGEFSNDGYGKGGAVVIALESDRIGACAVEMADVGGDIDSGIRDAARRISIKLGKELHDLPPDRFAGLVLLEGAKGREERINEALGNVAPFLPFVGGSAGDDITFSGTWAFVDGKVEKDGTALVIAEILVPFVAMKTCHFEATERTVTVTRVDIPRRLIVELDGKPAARYYAEAIGVDISALGFEHFLAHPLGLMINGEPWLRSGVRVEGEALLFACSVVEGAKLHFMRAGDIVSDAEKKLAQVRESLGGSVGGAIFFNCAYRLIEANITGCADAYHQRLSTIPHAGCHSNGETYIGHINQTLTGLVLA